MDKILAPIKQRILKVIEFKGLEKKKFFEEMNVSASNFRSKSLHSEVGGELLAKISSLYPDINIEWLITGKGEMLLSEEENEVFQTVGEEQHEYNTDQNENEVNVKIILEVNGNTKERILKLLGSNPDLDFLK